MLLFFIGAKECNEKCMAGYQYIAGGCITIFYCIICSTLSSDQSILNATHTVSKHRISLVSVGLWRNKTFCLIYRPSYMLRVCAGLLEMDGFPVKITEAVCLGASLALSSICYYLYRKSRTTLDKLDVSCGYMLYFEKLNFLFLCCLSHRKG